MNRQIYEVSGDAVLGWGVFDPWGELIMIHTNEMDAHRHAKALNEAWGDAPLPASFNSDTNPPE